MNRAPTLNPAASRSRRGAAHKRNWAKKTVVPMPISGHGTRFGDPVHIGALIPQVLANLGIGVHPRGGAADSKGGVP